MIATHLTPEDIQEANQYRAAMEHTFNQEESAQIYQLVLFGIMTGKSERAAFQDAIRLFLNQNVRSSLVNTNIEINSPRGVNLKIQVVGSPHGYQTTVTDEQFEKYLDNLEAGATN